MRDYQGAEPTPTTERRRGRGLGDRNNIWLEAFRGGKPSPGDFLNAGPITEAVNLAGVAIRAGGKIVYDHENMKITNRPEVNKHFYREYRKGWEL